MAGSVFILSSYHMSLSLSRVGWMHDMARHRAAHRLQDWGGGGGGLYTPHVLLHAGCCIGQRLCVASCALSYHQVRAVRKHKCCFVLRHQEFGRVWTRHDGGKEGRECCRVVWTGPYYTSD
jgi:hypothetical protein